MNRYDPSGSKWDMMSGHLSLLIMRNGCPPMPGYDKLGIPILTIWSLFSKKSFFDAASCIKIFIYFIKTVFLLKKVVYVFSKCLSKTIYFDLRMVWAKHFDFNFVFLTSSSKLF